MYCPRVLLHKNAALDTTYVHHLCWYASGLRTQIKIIPRGTERMKERMTELEYQNVSTYLRAWYKGKKKVPP